MAGTLAKLNSLLVGRLAAVQAAFVPRSLFAPSGLRLPFGNLWGEDMDPVLAVLPSSHHVSHPEDEPCDEVHDMMKEGFVLMATVPKKRRSHSRIRLRQIHKFPENRRDIEACSQCGLWKLRHHLCLHCVKAMKKAAKKDSSSSATQAAADTKSE